MKILNNRNFLLTVVALFLFTLFIGNSVFTLWDTAEGTYAALAKDVYDTGNWLTPSASWMSSEQVFPLQVWLTALSYSMLGVTEFAVRFPSLLALIGVFVAFYFFGKERFGEETITFASIVLCSSLIIPSIAKIGTPDALALLCTTMAILAFYNYLQNGLAKWNYIFWGAIALGLLANGVSILILAVGIWLFLFAINTNERSKLMAMKPWLLLPLALTPFLIWLIAVFQADSSYFFQVWYASGEGSWSSLPGFHFLILCFAFLPWVGFLPNSIMDSFKGASKKETDGLFFTGVLILGWIIYELFPFKLPTTALAVHPLLAILIAQQFLHHKKACEKYHDFSVDEHPKLRAQKAGFNKENWIKTAAILGLISTFLLTLLLMLNSYHYVGPAGMRSSSMLSLVFWGTGFLGIIGLYSRNPNLMFYNMFIGGFAFSLLLWVLIVPILEPAKSVNKRAVTEAIKQAEADVPVVIAVSPSKQMPSLPFYVSQTFKDKTMIEDASDLEELMNDDKEQLFIVEDFYKDVINVDSTLQPVQGYWLNRYEDVQYWVYKH